ncbi:cobalamin binding intrinsic factor-like isoform X2 [Ptychodera flava]|uniref:cobalamin binding intrinsic factor-like isoform X2 n=1 Tax=Ptychodera flava TaxID=63121 RepID=UPI00396A0292
MKFGWSIGILVLTIACRAVANVCGPDTSGQLQSAAAQAYDKAVDWLKSQQNDQYGWDQGITPRVVMSLQASSDNSWYNEDDLLSEITVKQMENELLQTLSHKPCKSGSDSSASQESSEEADGPTPRDPLTAGRLAYPIMALHSTCRDVTDFHGHDLIDLINRKIMRYPEGDFNHFYQYGFAVLALCTTGSVVKQEYIDEIRNGQHEDGGFTIGTDVTAIVVMALSCVHDKTSLDVDETLQKAVDNLLASQKDDGSFGNINTNSLVVQALSAAGINQSNWQCSDVMKHILAKQQTSGAFGLQALTTVQVLPSLTGANFGQIDDSACSSDEAEPTDDTGDGGDQLISMSLTVIDDTNGSGQLGSFQTSIVEGTNLYNAMVKIQDETNFEFQASSGAWGHYIEMIFGVWADPSQELFWAIYNYTEPLQTGVDSYFPENNDHIYFKYISYSECC